MSYNNDPFNSYNDSFDDGFGGSKSLSTTSSRNRKRKKKQKMMVVIIAIVLVVALVGVGAFFFLNRDAGSGDDPGFEPVKTEDNGSVVTGGSGRNAMDTPDLADYVAERTVTVKVTGAGFTATGSGFFIDDNGTIVTNFHVIDGAESMEVAVADGGSYTVEKVIDFDIHHDVAIIQVDLSGNPYLEIAQEEVRTGEQVYAIGSSLGILDGTFSDGIVSNTNRNWGVMQCIQTTAPITNGNSGGPLVNVYGEVVGINTWGYSSGQNLNFAVRIDTLDMLAKDKNFNMSQYREWYRKETMRSYMAYNYASKKYEQTMINTYQYITGQDCAYSALNWDLKNMVQGYDEDYGIFLYAYNAENFDQYTDYLNNTGFEYIDSGEDRSGTLYLYYNDHTGYYVKFCVTYDDALLILEAYCQ